MSSQRFSFHAAVYLLLKKDSKVLFLRRYNTGWNDGFYTLPAGHLDGNESVIDAMLRESSEEIGITINPSDLKVIHVCHHSDDKEYIDFYLTTDSWQGEPEISEPDKCDELRWYDTDNLPKNILPNVKSVLDQIKNDSFFSEYIHAAKKS